MSFIGFLRGPLLSMLYKYPFIVQNRMFLINAGGSDDSIRSFVPRKACLFQMTTLRYVSCLRSPIKGIPCQMNLYERYLKSTHMMCQRISLERKFPHRDLKRKSYRPKYIMQDVASAYCCTQLIVECMFSQCNLS